MLISYNITNQPQHACVWTVEEKRHSVQWDWKQGPSCFVLAALVTSIHQNCIYAETVWIDIQYQYSILIDTYIDLYYFVQPPNSIVHIVTANKAEC